MGFQSLAVRKSSGTYTPTGFGIMSLPKKHHAIVILFTFAAAMMSGVALVAQQDDGELPFLYPDPRTVGVHPYVMHGKPAGAVTPDRYAGVTEQERQRRILWEKCLEELGLEGIDAAPCPLCVEPPNTPCRTCKLCLAGFPCEKTLCRHCVQPRSKNMNNSCDLTAGDEPCGTCDSCREHRSDPCEHADTEYGPFGEFNPYKEPDFLAVIPRPILDVYNNGARKFPVYYNPAPYYRPTWNPSTFAGYARPFTFRYSCPLCFRDPCGCDRPGMAGQVPYAYTCNFCKRNPCACTVEICDVTKLMDPIGVAQALTEMNADRERAQQQRQAPTEVFDTPPSTTTQDVPPESDGGGIQNNGGLFEDTLPETDGQVPPTMPRPSLDGAQTPRMPVPTLRTSVG